jgi:magnesium chelatase family protein
MDLLPFIGSGFQRFPHLSGRKRKEYMVFKVYSGRVRGVFGDLITVEVDASPGLPEISIIGLPGSAVKEAKDRVKVALKNCGVTIPSVKLVINLSPADEHKEYTGLDLPIAVGFLGVFGHLSEFDPATTLLLGEISLDGKLIPVRGVLPIVKMAAEKGFKKVILPKENAEEGALIHNIKIIPAESVMDVMTYLGLGEPMKDAFLPPVKEDPDAFSEDPLTDCDFKDVYGQESVKRAAAIAASGFHHLLLTGPPGTGKSLIAKRIPGIMPSLTYEESLEVTTIYSVSGKLKEKASFIKKRPFISPHHSASSIAFTGGGPQASPGLVSLSHKGILFLDEMTEFKKETLDMLRQPLEDRTITVSRTKSSLTYPAEFMLVGAMNPCPCGFYPDRNRCSCSDSSIERYLKKLSGPILDRIDMVADVSRIGLKEMEKERAEGLDSMTLKSMVMDAVKRQEVRFKNESFRFNAQIPTSRIDEFVPLNTDAKDFLYKTYESLNLSMRSFYKMIRVARSIADFDGDEKVSVKHLAEASCYRFPEYIRR